MTREEMCIKFCNGLSDDALAVAVNNDFTAAILWEERDTAFRNLARRFFDPYESLPDTEHLQ